MKKNTIAILICILSYTISSAQWTKGKDKGYFKLSAWFLEADKHYTDTGKTDPNATRGVFNLSLYGEYGLTNNIDAVLYLPFLSRVYQNNIVSGTNGNIIQEGEALNSIGDIDIAIRYGLVKKEKIVVSASLLLGIPTGISEGGSDGSYQTGDGEFNQLIKTSVGLPFSFIKRSSYLKAYVGFNNRTNGFSDEFRTGGELGINVTNKLWLNGKLGIVKSLKNRSLNAQNSQGSIFANNVEYASYSFEGAYYITKKMGISLNYASAFSGRIIYAAPSISGGIFLDIK